MADFSQATKVVSDLDQLLGPHSDVNLPPLYFAQRRANRNNSQYLKSLDKVDGILRNKELTLHPEYG